MMNKINNIMVVALSSLALVGCGTYSNFHASQEVEITDSLYSYIEATNNTENFASLSWRELFTDPQLQSLIEQGLENNTNLNLARLNVEQAEVALKTARLAYLPSLNFTPNGAINSFKGNTTKTYNIAVSAAWEIDLFGKLRNAKEQSKAALEQSRAYTQAIQTELISAIANSYYSLLTLDEQLDITERTKTNWSENLRAMKAMKEAGRINQLSVSQSEANNIALEGSIVALKQQIAELENTLSTLLGQTPRHIERGSIESVSFPSEVSVGVPIQLLSNRPDVRVAEHTLAQAFYATGEARSSLYPSINLSGSAGFTNSFGSIFNPGDMLYSAVASLVQPIFNRGVLRAQLNISKAAQEQALLQFKQSLLDAGAEVNTALIGWQSAKELLEHDKSQIVVLEKVLGDSELLMSSGSANYLDVLTAQLSLLQSELSFSSNKFNEIQSVINLYRSLGGGVQ